MAFGPYKPLAWRDVLPRSREAGRRHAPHREHRTTEQVALDCAEIKRRLLEILRVGPRMKKELWKLFPKAREDDLSTVLQEIAYSKFDGHRYRRYYLIQTPPPMPKAAP